MRFAKLAICLAALLWTTKAQSRGYVESGTCAVCHSQIAQSYALSGMARTFGALRSPQQFPELSQGRFEHTVSAQRFTVFAREDKAFLKRQHATSELESQIDYWFGSGRHARSYVSRTSADDLIELPLTWYTEGKGYWAMSPGYDRPDHAGFSRKLTYRCMSCHNSFIELPNPTWEAGTRFPAKIPEGIDCQRCHGPGQAHVESARQGLSSERVREAIVNPARLPTQRQMELCMQCHLETTTLKLPATLLRAGREVFSYRSGEPLSDYILHFDRAADGRIDDRFEFASAAYQLRKSACFTKSGGTLVCTTCHNPHEPSSTPAAQGRYVAACQKCHQQKLSEMIAASRHTNRQDCASCHLPKRRPSDAIHTSVTDHFIQARPPAATATATAIELHDGNAAPYRGPVDFYYPAQLRDKSEQELYRALAQVKHDSNLTTGLPALESALKRYEPRQAEFYFELAEAYRRAGKQAQAAEFYELAGQRTSTDWRIFHRLGSLLTTMQQADRARAALDRALALAPREPVILEAISNWKAQQGDTRGAVELLHTAIGIEPTAAYLHAALGARLLQLNDVKGAEKAWREAVRLRPEAASNCLNLANLLMRIGAFAEGVVYFQAAIRSAPSFPDTHLAYAIALAAHGRTADAERELRATIQLAPDHYEAHLRLGMLLQDRGDTKNATWHLEKARESAEARIREAADVRLRRP